MTGGAECRIAHPKKTGACEAVCPKGISLNFIAKMNRDSLAAMLRAPSKKKTAHAEA